MITWLAFGSEAQTRQTSKVQTPAQTGVESAAAPSILVSPSEDYKIGARDVIEIKVDDAPELSITVPVNADGTFLMPYLKRVKAEGKTPEELAREIADQSGPLFKRPQCDGRGQAIQQQVDFRPGRGEISGRLSDRG